MMLLGKVESQSGLLLARYGIQKARRGCRKILRLGSWWHGRACMPRCSTRTAEFQKVVMAFGGFVLEWTITL